MGGKAERLVGLRNRSLIGAAPAFALGLIVLVKARTVQFVLTSDMAHYLADADALFGDGVRDLRHLPAYPAALGFIRLFMSDLAAIRAGVVFVMLMLYVAGLVVFNDRVRHPLAAVLGAAMLAACPVVAEGLAWGGMSMLLGFAFALLAMHYVDHTLHDALQNSVALAALFSSLTVLTHPLPAAMLAVVSVAMSSYRVAGQLRSGRSVRELATRIAIIGVVAAGALFATRNLYFSLEQPSSAELSFQRLSLLWSWAFRDLWMFWLPFVFVGAVIVPTRNGPLRSLGAWSATITGITLVQTAALGGSPSYVTRPLYSLCFPAALGAAWAVDTLLESVAGRNAHRVVAAAIGSIAIAVAFWSFSNRMGVAVPYYNRVTGHEIAALEFMARQTNAKTVLVSGKGRDQDAGTLYAWMFEGLSKVRAIGPGHRFLYLLPSAVVDSDDAERFFVGETTSQVGRVRVGQTDGFAQIQLKVKNDWEPLALIRGARFEPVQIEADKAGYSVVLRGEHEGALVEVVPTTGARWSVDAADKTASVSVETENDSVPLRVSGFTGDVSQSSSERSAMRVLSIDPDDRAIRLTVDIGVPQPTTSARTSFTSADGLDGQDVTHVVSWTVSPEFGDLQRRRCLKSVYTNPEITVWRVVGRCR